MAATNYLQLNVHWLPVPYSNLDRRIRVLLPANYDTEDKHYPVVYMHDGQNVFYNKESFSGHSWRVIQTLKKTPILPEMIIVGIDNAEIERMNEYTPWPVTNSPYPLEYELGGEGAAYGKFVMEKVKPFVDYHYRTKTEKEYTAMCGSSLGANITSYLGIKYKDLIGNLGIFSSANWLTQQAFTHYFQNATIDLTQKIFIQVGTQEGDDTDRRLMYGNMKQTYINTSLDYYKHLIQKGLPIDQIKLEIIADAKHEEKAWAQSLPSCLEFFSKDWH